MMRGHQKGETDGRQREREREREREKREEGGGRNGYGRRFT